MFSILFMFDIMCYVLKNPNKNSLIFKENGRSSWSLFARMGPPPGITWMSVATVLVSAAAVAGHFPTTGPRIG